MLIPVGGIEIDREARTRLINHYVQYTAQFMLFALPWSNLLILLFSSIACNFVNVAVKLGYLYGLVEGLVTLVTVSYCFLFLQFIEFFYSLWSINDMIIGSIYFFTTGLHGAGEALTEVRPEFIWNFSELFFLTDCRYITIFCFAVF